MGQREILSGTTATIAAATPPSMSKRPGGDTDAQIKSRERYGVRITVLRKDFEKEFIEKLKTGPAGPCTRLNENQEFTITSQWEMPEGFCQWAWADIRTYVPMVLGFGSPFVVCCTDGFRPVFFKLERIEL
jgi:uncharacterized repeat protein (TIGR04076 family)